MSETLPIPEWLKPLYPFTPKIFVTPRGAQMSYLDEGPRSDEAVLMLHGNPTWSFYYRNLVKALAPNFRCIVPDHIGMGLSEKPLNYDYRLATRIADIEALLVTLKLKRIHLIVHDWGGAIGFGLAVRRHDLIGRIVISNTAAYPSIRIPWRIWLCRMPLLGALIVRGFNGFAGPATHMAVHQRSLTGDETTAYLLPYDNWDNRLAVYRFVRDIPMEKRHPSRPVLEEISAQLQRLALHPKLIVWGGRDFCFNDHFLARWRRIYPQAEVERYENAGHYLLEDAGDKVISRITEFLLKDR